MSRTQRSLGCVVLGCSAGGVHALLTLLPGLRQDLAVPLVLVCHTGADDVDLLCEVLAHASPLPVVEARERMRPAAGVVHLAPAGYHLYLENDGQFMLSIDPKVCFVRPSIDVLFESAADCYRSRLLAVVLSGANDDGARGLQSVRGKRGYAIVQDPAEAEMAQMPTAALRLAGADEIRTLSEISTRINELCL